MSSMRSGLASSSSCLTSASRFSVVVSCPMRRLLADVFPHTSQPVSERDSRSPTAASSGLRRALPAVGGPVLIVALVLFAMRGFVFRNALSDQHPDILAFWFPRWCFLGRSLAAGPVPVWDSLQFSGVPFAADPQSGWLYAPVLGL